MEKNFKKIISQVLGKAYEIKSIREIPGGFRSKAYKITALKNGQEKKLFLKHLKSDPSGLYQNPIEKLDSYLVSHEINSLLKTSPESLGVFLFQDNKIISLDPPQEKDLVFQLQEFVEGENYSDYLFSHESDIDFIENNKPIIDGIIKGLAKIHKKKISLSSEKKKMIYKKSLRTPMVNSELALTMIEDNIEGSLFEGDLRYEYIKEMMKVAEYFWPEHSRLSVIHGDFWPGNMILRKNNPAFLDYSRYCYGDPGVDVGHFYLSLVIFSILRKNKKYLELAEYFLKKYEKVVNDKMIRKAAVISFGPVGVVFILDNFFPKAARNDRKKFANYIMKCLKSKKVIPYKL